MSITLSELYRLKHIAVTSLYGAVIVGLLGFAEHRTVFTPFASARTSSALQMMMKKTRTQKQMFNSISWTSAFLIAGMTAAANAVSRSGPGSTIANAILSLCGGSRHPVVIIAVLLPQSWFHDADSILCCRHNYYSFGMALIFGGRSGGVCKFSEFH